MLPLQALLHLLALLALAAAQSTTFVPTVPTSTSTSTAPASTANTTTASCPALHHDCAVVGRPDACCTLDQVCVFDESQRLACCPFRTVCVGSLGVSEGAGGRRRDSTGGVVGIGVGVVLGAMGALVGWW